MPHVIAKPRPVLITPLGRFAIYITFFFAFVILWTIDDQRTKDRNYEIATSAFHQAKENEKAIAEVKHTAESKVVTEAAQKARDAVIPQLKILNRKVDAVEGQAIQAKVDARDAKVLAKKGIWKGKNANIRAGVAQDKAAKLSAKLRSHE